MYILFSKMSSLHLVIHATCSAHSQINKPNRSWPYFHQARNVIALAYAMCLGHRHMFGGCRRNQTTKYNCTRNLITYNFCSHTAHYILHISNTYNKSTGPRPFILFAMHHKSITIWSIDFNLTNGDRPRKQIYTKAGEKDVYRRENNEYKQ